MYALNVKKNKNYPGNRFHIIIIKYENTAVSGREVFFHIFFIIFITVSLTIKIFYDCYIKLTKKYQNSMSKIYK
jgi:hypothetical protein